ncbi:glycine cleavage system protein H [Thermodesulfobacteriota bacterium]
MGATRTENRLANTQDLCIWMQAGVVPKKHCKTDYDCVACRFDKSMRRLAIENKKARDKGIVSNSKRGKIVFWKERLKKLSSWKRPCLHHMKSRIDFKACTNEYRCDNCEFDQYFYDEYSVHAIVKPVNVLDIEGFKIPQGFYLHRGHTWIKIEEGGEARIGLDDFALRLLGPLDGIEAPLVGKELKQDRADIKMNRGSNTAKVLSPLNGVVTAVNPKLRKQGRLANVNPYSEGWVARIHSSTLRRDLKNLMIGNETGDFLRDEVDRLYRVIEAEAGPLAADGGQLGNDIYGNIPQIGWKRLTGLFLRT